MTNSGLQVPRQLQANEVFLLLGKANDGLMEVLTVPWDPSERGGMRFEWAWAHLYSVYELAEMFKATRRIDVQNKSSKVTIADSEIDVDALWLKTFEFMHETGQLSPAEKTAAKEFVETLARKLDKNGDKKLHLPELLGPLGALDDKKNACSTDEPDASSVGAPCSPFLISDWHLVQAAWWCFRLGGPLADWRFLCCMLTTLFLIMN